MTTANIKSIDRMTEAAKRYAAADKSDPFSYARAMAHIKNGICSASRPANREYDIMAGVACYYDAESALERRTVTYDGRDIEFDVVVWRNMVRP